MATKDLGKDRIGFDFRKDQFRYERRFEKLKYPLVLTGILLCAFFLQLVFDLVAQYQFWGQRARDVRAKEVEYYNAFWGDRAQKRKGRLLAKSSARLKTELEESMGKGGNIPIILDEIQAFAEIRDVLPRGSEKGYRL